VDSQVLDRTEAEVDVADAAVGLLPGGFVDAGPIRIEGEDGGGLCRVLKCEAPVPAADLEDAFVVQAGKALDQPHFVAVGRIRRKVQAARHGRMLPEHGQT